MQELTQASLKEKLHYDPETGVFTWRSSGKLAGHIHIKGYCRVKINSRLYYAHRLIFLYMTGVWPSDQVDHINGTRGDNRWVNLREATSQQNNMNRSTAQGTRIKNGSHHATIFIGGRNLHIGSFATFREAMTARILESLERFGDFSPYNCHRSA